MRKEYREMFGEVHASDRLRMEVLNLKNAENSNVKVKHGVPRAAFIAAVLLVVLAGTALAGEYAGLFRIQWLEGFRTLGEEIDGYQVFLQDVRFPAEKLSDEVFTVGAEGDGYRRLKFKSKASCEEFLGVKLAANPILSKMQTAVCLFGEEKAHVWLSLYYNDDGLPSMASADAYYRQGNDITVNQGATLRTQYDIWGPENWDILVPQHGEESLEYETYTMANGAEAIIFKETYGVEGRFDFLFLYDECHAYFIKDDIRYSLDVSVRNTLRGPEPSEAGTQGVSALESTKEILDAYE